MPDGVHLAPSSLADLKRLGEAYKAGEKDLRNAVRKGLQAAAKPLEEEVIREGSAQMPKRGGLAARLAAARGGVTVALSGRNVSVSIRAKTREGYALRKINEGIVRHPVYGHMKVWEAQRVPVHAYSEVFDRGAPRTLATLNRAVQGALDDIARKA